MDKKRLTGISIFVALVIVVFVPRLLDLDAFRTADEKRWLANTTGFTNRLAHGQPDRLVQQPHPGITTQWLGALTIRYDDQVLKKLPLVIGQGLMILAAAYVFARLWGKPAGAMLALLLAVNPLLYAHTRIYAMDSLLSLFLILSLGLLLLWHQTAQHRYLLAAGFTGAAAFLSKLPGLIIIPFTLMVFTYWIYREYPHQVNDHNAKLAAMRHWLKPLAYWLLAFVVGLVIILPSFAIAPRGVIGDFTEFFRSDEFTVAHHAGPAYYLRTWFFFSSPIHWLTLMILPLAFYYWHRHRRRIKLEHAVFFLLFAVLFTIQMTLGAKKGDRYILPAFLSLDVLAAIVITWLLAVRKRHALYFTATILFLATIFWQAAIIWQTHPYTLAYVNPLTRDFFGDRRHGWGEGLDLAANYLNDKPNAADLTVASMYPAEFGPYFTGTTVPGNQFDTDVDYVIIYRGMLERGDGEWETDAVEKFKSQQPEHIIKLSGIDFVWIYKQ